MAKKSSENSLRKYLEAIRENLLPYQIKWIADDSRFRVWLKSRQIGGSFAIALEATMRAIAGTDQLIVSAAERQSINVLREVKRWVSIFETAGLTKTKRSTETELELSNGKRILSLPQNPETIRGFAGDVYLDEFAHHSSADEIYTASIPIVTRGYRFSVLSTALGQSGRFYSLYSDERTYPNYSRHRTTITEAIESGLSVDLDAIRNATDEELFRQEYLCEFVDESTSYFPYELLLSNTGDTASPMLDGTTNYIGIDVGRRSDRTAIIVLSELNEALTVKKVEVLDRMEFARQKEIIRQIIQEHSVTGGAIDSSGLGMQLAEELNKEFAWLEPVTFNNAIKETIAVTVKRKLEERRLTIPNDKHLISDIHSIKRTVTQAGNTRFDAERTAKGHSDRFWGLALAVYSVTNPVYAPEVRFV